MQGPPCSQRAPRLHASFSREMTAEFRDRDARGSWRTVHVFYTGWAAPPELWAVVQVLTVSRRRQHAPQQRVP